MFTVNNAGSEDPRPQPQSVLSEPLFTPDQVAAALSAKRPTILEWARDGRLPSIQLPNKERRFTRHDVEVFLAGCA